MAQVAPAQQSPFVWEGTDKKGKRIKGKMLAVSEAAVKADLRRQGVLAKRVRKEVQLFKSGKKITSEDIALFARQLATMLHLLLQAALAVYLVLRARRRGDPTVPFVALAGVALAVVAGVAIYEDFWSYTRVLVWLPLGVALAALQARKKWVLLALAPASVWVFAVARIV